MMRLLPVALLAGGFCAAVVVATASSQSATRPLRYIALGDSFSSGEGDPPYEAASNRYLPPHDICHRSYQAYPALVATRRGISEALGFWACSGARIRDLTSSNFENPTEPAQLDRVALPGRSDPLVDLVTLTIGGNDAQFGIVSISCLASRVVSPFGDRCSQSWRRSVEASIGHVRAALPAVFRELRARAPRARIFALGYPDPFPAALPALSRCSFWFSPGDLRWLSQEAAALNNAIKAATIRSRAGVVYLAPSGFSGHDVCSNDPWFNGVLLLPSRVRGSFHPNALGQRQMARNLLARL